MIVSDSSPLISLARIGKLDLLHLMDERLGRDTARYFGVRCIGLLGILAGAKFRGEIEAVKPVLDLLRNRAGYRIGAKLYQRVLHEVQEVE